MKTFGTKLKKNQPSTKRKLVIFTMGLIVLILIMIGSSAVYALVFYRPDSSRETTTVSDNLASEPEDNKPQTTHKSSDTTADSQPTISSTVSGSTTYKTSFDKNKYISAGYITVANYNKIVELVTFTPSMSEDDKADRIKQAVSLDRQYFSQVTDLRECLVLADISSGPYVDATALAESSVSKISNGVTFLSYWADSRSRTSSFVTGAEAVQEGKDSLDVFAQRLISLP